MDSLLCQYKRGPVRALGYADDLLLYITGIDTVCMSDLLQNEINKVVSWGNSNGLTFNPKKTKMVLFTRKRSWGPEPTIKLNDEELNISDSFKYLGIEKQRSLNWNKHVMERANKCKFILSKCRGLISRRWGLTPLKLTGYIGP